VSFLNARQKTPGTASVTLTTDREPSHDEVSIVARTPAPPSITSSLVVKVPVPVGVFFSARRCRHSRKRTNEITSAG